MTKLFKLIVSLMIVCGAIGIAAGTARGGEWEDGQLAHGIIATIAVLAFVFLTVNLVFLSLSNKLFGRSSMYDLTLIHFHTDTTNFSRWSPVDTGRDGCEKMDMDTVRDIYSRNLVLPDFNHTG